MPATNRWARAGQRSRSSLLKTPTSRRKKLCNENTRKRCWPSRLSVDSRRTTSLRFTATRFIWANVAQSRFAESRKLREVFYGKELRDITLSEAATLAGMIQSPAHYSPLRHPDEARARRNVVLAAMQQNGWITSEQNAKASAEPVTVASGAGVENSMAPYFVDYVNRLAESQFETSGNNQRIYTTIDLELQQAAEQALKRQLDQPRYCLFESWFETAGIAWSRSIRIPEIFSRWLVAAITLSRS